MSERKIWLEEEDKALKALVEQRGIKSWAEISRVMAQEFQISGRSGKQCRQRYHNHLNQNIKHGPWSRQEEGLLVELQEKFGNRWADISRAIAGRSENTVKNKYFSLVRKGVRVLNTAIRRQLKKYKELDNHLVRQIVDSYDPILPKEQLTLEMVECRQIKKRLLFYGLRDDCIPLASQDYTDIKKLIDQIRVKRKNISSGKIDHSMQMTPEESCEKGLDSVEKKEQTVEIECEKIESRDRIENEEKKERKNSGEERSMNECVLGLKKISFQSFGLEPLEQLCQQQSQGYNGPINPIMSKNLSNKSNLSLFEGRQLQNDNRGELLRKQSTLRSFELPQLDHIRSPFMMIDSPHFDQVPLKGSFSSWSYLFHH